MERLEKAQTAEGRNGQDLRVLLIGVCIYIGMILSEPVLFKIWDRYFATRPFMTATVQVGIVPGRELPMIYYDADANQEVDAQWIASVIGLQMEQLATRRGQGAYSDKVDIPRLWSWEAFFKNEYGAPAPVIPTEPFRVCVRYIATARDSKEQDESPMYCSLVFDPENPRYIEFVGNSKDL